MAIGALASSGTDSQSGSTLTWSATGLPAGLSIDPSTGSITGTPTTAGTSSVTVTATDGAGYSGSASFSWTITNTVSVANPGSQSDVSGVAIGALASSGTDSQSGSTLTWSATGLPAGLSIDPSTGSITGTPTTAGTSSVTVTATDGAGYSGSASFSWTITNTVSVANPGSQSDVSGVAIGALASSGTDSQSGSTLTWSATGLPAGLSIDPSTGSITGTPTTAGTSSVTVTATDGAGYSGSASFSWTITNTVSVANPGSQSDVSGVAIGALASSGTDSQSGSTLTWSATGLPAGLSIDPSTGSITGTPTTAGTSSVTVTATDGAGYSGSASFSWTITNTVSVANPGSQSDVSGVAIGALASSGTDSQSGSTLTWSATGLPAGLSIDPSTGSITGTPTTAGTSSVTVTATDGAGYSGSASFSWTITNTVTVTNPGDQSDPAGTTIGAVTTGATDSSPSATLTYSATGLPAGLSINATTGTITGTPTTGGTSSVVLTATDDRLYRASPLHLDRLDSVTVTGPGTSPTCPGAP